MSAKRASGDPRVNANGRVKIVGEGRGKGGGRPALQIDARIVAGMAFAGATTVEIAEFLECSTDVIERRFAAHLRKKRSSMRLRLRRAQFRLAMEGNVTMLIWLGKQYLGQSDHPMTLSDAQAEQPRQSIMVGGQKIFF